MDLSIITVPWNVKDLVRENFKALYANPQGIGFEVFAVDNDSKDGTAQMIATEFPQVNLIANNFNAGFAKANNQAIRMAQGRYILLLNPDMRVLPDTLKKMVDWMDAHPEAGVAGCRLTSEDGTTMKHVRRYPTLWDQLAIVLKLPHVFPGILKKYLYDDFDYSREAEVDSIRGSFFMIRKEALDKAMIGKKSDFFDDSKCTLPLLDERYFIWFEEVDFCRQIRMAGFKVMYTPVAECIDFVGKSFSQVKRGVTQNYFRDSMLKYFKKWHGPCEYFILKTAWPIGFMITWILVKIGYQGKART